MKTVLITLVLLFGATAAHELTRSKRLTAFGKTPEVTQPPLVGKGKECKSDEECAHIVFSSCKVDDRDSRRRCICNDGTPIKNGQCVNRPRVRRGYVPSGPRREEKDMVLFKPAPTPQFFPNPEKIKSANGTSSTRKPLFVPHIRLGIRENCKNDGECLEGGECKINPNATTPQERRTKVCLCREGRIELNNQCNGCDRNSNVGHLMMAFGIVSILLNWRGV